MAGQEKKRCSWIDCCYCLLLARTTCHNEPSWFQNNRCPTINIHNEMIHSRHISVALHEMYTWLRVTSADARAPEMATLHANHTMTNGKGWNSKCCMKVLVDECPAKAKYIFSFTSRTVAETCYLHFLQAWIPWKEFRSYISWRSSLLALQDASALILS